MDAEVNLDSATYTTTGTKTLSWSDTYGGQTAEAKRYQVTVNSGDAVVTLNDVQPTNISFVITGSSIDVSIGVWGNRWNTEPSFEGEYISHTNMTNNKGITSRIINPLVISDAECHDIAEGFIDDYGTVNFETNNVKWPYLNLMPEINDMQLLWSRWTYTDDLYYINSISYHWDNSRTPSDSTDFKLDDSGLNFSDVSSFIYDDIIDYDTGYVYDMAHGVGATEAEAEAAFDHPDNVDFS